jgi:uncharacterized protein (TIGR02246 family)
MTESLERRVRAIEAQLEIRQLVNNYFAIADRLDWKGWAGLFAADGVFVVPDTKEELKGPAEIYRVTEQRLGGAFQDTQHYIANLDVKVDGDVASAAGDFIFAAVKDRSRPNQHLLLGGRYSWSFVRENSAWRVARASNAFVWNNMEDEATAEAS